MRRDLIYLIYRLLLWAAFPFLLAYLLGRGLRDKRYFRHLQERFGFLPHSFQGTAHGAIWLHAVSVGEVLSSARLIEQLRRSYPARRIFVSSTTLAGRALAEEKLSGLIDGVFYAPIDYCFAVRKVLRRIRPSVVVILETEIWPYWYRNVKQTGAGLIIVNGRISDKALPAYDRFRWLFREVLSYPDLILAQSEESAGRYLHLGAPPERVRHAGNLKFDFDPSKAPVPDAVQALLSRSRPAPVWIAASTMPPAHPADVDEDDAVIAAFQRLAAKHPRLLLIQAPRRPARFDEAAKKLDAAKIPFRRRSQLRGDEKLPLPGVLLLDTIGELSGVFPAADVVFMGGTLARCGGHNILEPAFSGRPVIVGPHMENFAAIARQFRAGGGFLEIRHSGELGGAVDRLLQDRAFAEEIGRRARHLAEAERGATERALAAIRQLTDHCVAHSAPPLVLRALLWPLSRLWGAGVRRKRRRAARRRSSLETPVISIGGISLGGAGKTPFTLYLAEKLRNDGRSPAILTRGYRRLVAEPATILEAGSPAPVTLTGDEAQIYLRSRQAPIGIGADRYAAGRLLEQRFHPGVILLDDGFQHWQLRRDLDIVLIDALDPFAGGELFPLGRLREPLAALQRAGALVITRVEPDSPIAGIEKRLREFNRCAPIFHAQVLPLGWVDAVTGEILPATELSHCRLAAFCGLANPASFWRTLASLGCRPVGCWSFPDHHRYRLWELQRVARHAQAAGAEVVVTTEKDLMNLLPAAEATSPLRLLWLRIGLQVSQEDALLELVRSCAPQARAASS